MHWAVFSHPVLSGLLPIRPPQGTFWMKFMSDRGTFNISNDLGMRNANTPTYTQAEDRQRLWLLHFIQCGEKVFSQRLLNMGQTS